MIKSCVPASIAVLLITLIGIGFPSGASAILIDGHAQDWESLRALPIPEETGGGTTDLGRIEAMKVSQDDDFIYVYLEFARPRPFVPSGRQQTFLPGVWDDLSYVEIDRDGDGVWDYRTRMVKGKRVGFNNMVILGRVGEQAEGRIVLDAEGRKDYRPLGPRGFFAVDNRSVELRIPRLPLRLQTGVVHLRARVKFRDDASGSKDWTTRYYPSNRGWIALQLRPALKSGERNLSDSPARKMEPVIAREEFENEVGPRYARYPGAYMYPWRAISPSEAVAHRAREPEVDGDTGRPGGAGAPRSVLIIGADGEIQMAPPAVTSSDDPEEGQGVPEEWEAIDSPDGSRYEVLE
jgi:hypothetical protein